LNGVEAILHAGDVGSEDVLEDLRKLAPVFAVRGNVDPPALELPPKVSREFEGVRVEMVHQLNVPQPELVKWSDGSMLGKLHPERRDQFLHRFGDATRVIIFGHSHQPLLLTLGHRLFFNPGSAGQKRFSLPRSCGVLEVFPRGIRGEVMGLDPDPEEERLPDRIWLPIVGE
jgi:putative phosphoesterase